ncbi:CHAP domain-containing protein [Stenotrophobium rhamnosiphilum]|uniref:CHAP domain-containing protein n=1 Tax=Stenotrophobium rhamnosiphilum TaxID=2029166 RepID=UPI0019D05C4C|nr:CHAP domain-containing protein [Stenotrophobium rhamnosiphilum]
MSVRSHLYAALVIATSLLAIPAALAQVSAAPAPKVGDVVDRLNGIPVYFNGAIGHSNGRNITVDGYNLGLRYQCVEFVKRYYYQRLKHRMPNASGNAVQYFDAKVADGGLNKSRGLLQYRNGSPTAPQLEDILIFGPRPGNPYGHIVIVSAVAEGSLEFIQQNPGSSGRSRQTLALRRSDNGVTVNHPRVLGWLRLPGRKPAPQVQVPAPVPVPMPPPELIPASPPTPQQVPVLEPVAQEVEIPTQDTVPAPEIAPVPSEAPVNLPESPEAPSAKAP